MAHKQHIPGVGNVHGWSVPLVAFSLSLQIRIVKAVWKKQDQGTWLMPHLMNAISESKGVRSTDQTWLGKGAIIQKWGHWPMEGVVNQCSKLGWIKSYLVGWISKQTKLGTLKSINLLSYGWIKVILPPSGLYLECQVGWLLAILKGKKEGVTNFSKGWHGYLKDFLNMKLKGNPEESHHLIQTNFPTPTPPLKSSVKKFATHSWGSLWASNSLNIPSIIYFCKPQTKSSSMKMTPTIMITIRNLRRMEDVLQVQGGSWQLFFT